MARSVDKPDSDQKRRATPPEDWRKFLPPPAPRGKGYDPVPMVPDDPDPILPTPIEVDPPSRPHLITRVQAYGPSFDLPPDSLNSMGEFARHPSGGLLAMMAQAGVIAPSAPDTPQAGGLAALLGEYLRNNRQHAD
jgi:hypothetical protein